MKIKYAVNLDDVVAFNRFHSRHYWSSRQVAKVAGISCLMLLGMLHFSYGLISSYVGAIVFFSVAYAFIYRLFTIWLVGRAVRRLHSDGKNRGILGWHDLEITETGVHEISETGTADVRFDGIERIEETETHAFVYTGSLLAYVVPKSAVVEGDVRAFVTRLRELVRENAG